MGWRYRNEGPAGLADRSSRLHRLRRPTSAGCRRKDRSVAPSALERPVAGMSRKPALVDVAIDLASFVWKKSALERDEEKRESVFRRNQVYTDCVNLIAHAALNYWSRSRS
jgi:hypothetical protein